ncbi:MAG: zinc-finger domain-containing protein [Rhodobacteraceae bacterium]|nr:zinc-finger domain-containing protein [Paracoccaceae bacterium]MCY4197687.1 zinc-finger domain-containing protein [Paracoccaceae bacterium]MCY4325981.1 zinc-finger domain-containing protein [Paracoccaceae bacterium]
MDSSHDAPEVEFVTNPKVSCDGGGGALGHPKVWYVIPRDPGWIECGYCDKRFVFKDSADG